ncbi:unnamed protein product [Alopecurus aequalis]
MERRAARSSTAQHRRTQTVPEQKPQSHGGRQSYQRTPPSPGYFTVQLLMVFLWVAVSLAFLPLVLPPLPPPPLSLLLLPVGLLAVLAALAFVPLDAHSNVVGGGSSCL